MGLVKSAGTAGAVCVLALTLAAAPASADPAWTTVFETRSTDRVTSVAAGSAANQWAVGRPGDRAFRNTGGGWREVALPSGGARLGKVTASRDDNTWFTGANELLRYSAGSWRRHPLPSDLEVRDIEATGRDGVWVAGEHSVPPRDPDPEAPEPEGTPFLRHFDGARWTEHPLPSGVTVADLARRTDGEVWAAGAGEQGTVALRWNGSSWTVHRPPAPSVGGETEVQSVAPVNSGDVRVFGRNHRAPTGAVGFRFDGTSWTEITAPVTTSGFHDSTSDGAGGVWLGDPWATSIWRHTGGDWKRYTLPWKSGQWQTEMFAFARVPGTSRLLVGGHLDRSGEGGTHTYSGVILEN
ncbi:hypothetical protein [Spirillospora sp. CA-294931]|uniref:hypothetical protein n=1 Tax=Spirillospora sp. CA-294931 TaxID=3240042 RepID=UPI003D8FCE71